MTDTAKDIIDAIEGGRLEDAKGLIGDGIKQKAAEVVDMKRVELQVDWMNKEED